MAFDFTKADSMPDPTNADRTPFAPSPVLFLLIDEGTAHYAKLWVVPSGSSC